MLRTILRGGAIGLAISGALAAVEAEAQSAPAPTREELELGRTAATVPTARSRLSVEGSIERGPCPLAAPVYSNLKVNFARVRFEGLPGIAPDALTGAWQDFAGHEAPIATLCEVRDRAATRLRALGFLAAVQIPPQKIEAGGEVVMDVLAARLIDVEVRGNPGHAEALIAAHLRKLTAERWFNTREAERHLLLLRDLPGFDVRLVLRPAGTAPGEVVGEVMVKREPVEVVASVQNLGADATGPEGAAVQLQLNDLTGFGDRTLVSLYNTFKTSEQTVLQLSHDFALDANGLRFGARIVYGHARPKVASGSFSSETVIGDATLSYPFVRREALTVRGSGGLESVNQRVDFGTTVLSRDRLRVLFARLDFDTEDRASIEGAGGYSVAEPRWRLAGGIEGRQGTALFGASAACVPIARCIPPAIPISNISANPRAALIRADAELDIRPTHTVELVVSPRAQYAAAQLLNFEQFALGNYTVGRGFDAGQLQGDSGVASSFELRVGRPVPRTRDGFAFQPFGFLDTGWVWNNDGGLTHSPKHLWSAGGGVRARWGDHADLALTIAAPLDRAGAQTRLDKVRVLFTLTSRLVPWSTR